MSPVVRVSLVFLLASTGCAHAPDRVPAPAAAAPASVPTQDTASLPRNAKPIPPDLVAHVEESRRLGRAIFLNDVASARGTDVLLESGRDDPRIRGWVTRDLGDGRWSIQFVMPGGDHPLATHEVRLWGRTPELEAFDPPRPLSADAEHMFVATRTVAAQTRGPCPGRYNPVVLPGSIIGTTGLLVYWLASTDKAGQLVLAGHHRFHVAEDGQKVIDHEPLSRGCLMGELPAKSEGKVVGLYLNQAVADWPLETAVFTSLVYGKPIYVLTGRGTWSVDGDEIAYLGQ